MTQLNCDIDDLLKLTIDQQKLSAVLRVEINESGNSITREALCAYLDGCGINTQRILFDKIDELVEAIQRNPSQPNELIVVKGKPPIQGKNATFEFSDRLKERMEEISKREEALKLAKQDRALANRGGEDDETIDFYNASPFLIVSKDELVGRVCSSSPGEDGIDVLGQGIPTKQGKDLAELIDKSFRRDDQGNIHAMLDGHLTYNAMKLRINPTLEIDGHVDFSTGNIDFPSDVDIRDGVRDRFCVKSGESIMIQNLVEASTLESAKDIILHHGMAGRDTGTIRAGRDLKAGYIDGVQASIVRNCQITKEITNCHVTITGSLESPTAALRGGELSATSGGVIGSIGSMQGVKTDVVIGWIPEIEEKIKLALDLKEQVQKSIEKQYKELEIYKSCLGKPNAEQATEICYFESEIDSYKQKMTDLELAVDRLKDLICKNTAHTLDVKSVIFAKTTIWLPGFKATFEDDVKGELSISIDETKRPVVSRNGITDPLHTLAHVIADDRVLPLVTPSADDECLEESSDDALEAA